MLGTQGRRRAAVAGLVTICALLGIAGQALATPSIAANADNVAVARRYVLPADDTLDDLAERFGVDPAVIVLPGDPGETRTLAAGEVVLVPPPGGDGSTSRLPADPRTLPLVIDVHRVAPGETLAGISAEYEVDPAALASFNGIDDPNLLRVDQRLQIPAAVGGVAPSPTSSWEGTMAPFAVTASAVPATRVIPVPGTPGTPGATEVEWTMPPDGLERSPNVFVPNIPSYVQQRNLSCEYAAVFIATRAFGSGIPEAVFYDAVPLAANPHLGYRGDIDGSWGNTTDYGVYPEPLLPVLDVYGFQGEAFYAFGDGAELRRRLDGGRPVIVWLAYHGDTRQRLNDEGTYSVAAGIHVVVAFGYDDVGVHLSNPATGSFERLPWAEFTSMWQVLDGMGLAIAPETR
jgi:uncharacterized protein YvpB/LysM repeat protein